MFSKIFGPSQTPLDENNGSKVLNYFKYLAIPSVLIILFVSFVGLNSIVKQFVMYEAERDAIRICSALRDEKMDKYISQDSAGSNYLSIGAKEVSELDDELRGYLSSFDIVKIKIYNSEERIVFSTDARIIGDVDSGNWKLEQALSGLSNSKFEAKDGMTDLSKEERSDIKIVETYVPIYSGDQRVIGCFEVYKDVTNDLVVARNTLISVISVVSITVICVFSALSFVIHVANNIIKANNRKLVKVSHQAGKAEVATDVLHDVSNILNGINLSTHSLAEKISGSKVTNLAKVLEMIEEHSEDLGTFFTEDAQGKHIPVYLAKVCNLLVKEQSDIAEKLKFMAKHFGHMKDIVRMQQSYAKSSNGVDEVFISELIEEAVQINSSGLEKNNVRMVLDFAELPCVNINKHKVLHILVNLVSNAKDALIASKREDKVLRVVLSKHSAESLKIEVSDNGVGISAENVSKMFQHGYTTKKSGHGFGLHSSKLAASEIHGSLSVRSDGVGMGATFSLELPFKPLVPTSGA